MTLAMPGELSITFSNPAGPSLQIGPYASFCLQGETLRTVLGGQTIAMHEGHHWKIGGQPYSRFDCDCVVRISLSSVDGRRSTVHGPFASFSCMDGIAYADRSVFAFADRTIGDWYCHSDERHWATIIIETTD